MALILILASLVADLRVSNARYPPPQHSAALSICHPRDNRLYNI